VFAAQFALSHGCWLMAYPLAGQIGASLGEAAAFGALAPLAGMVWLRRWHCGLQMGEVHCPIIMMIYQKTTLIFAMVMVRLQKSCTTS
jgi:hypothetical protein